MKTYTSKSNAVRAAKGFVAKYSVANGYDVTGNATNGFMAVIKCDNAALTKLARAAGFSTEDYYAEADCGYNDAELAAMDEKGAGTSGPDGVSYYCPHCGVDHADNGYTFHGDEVNGERLALTKGTYVCLRCNGEWGPVPAGFAVTFDGFRAAGNSKCKSLRLTAKTYGEGRKAFIADAVGHGIKETTASANWACMKRGEF